jgi:hypothetical protein
MPRSAEHDIRAHNRTLRDTDPHLLMTRSRIDVDFGSRRNGSCGANMVHIPSLSLIADVPAFVDLFAGKVDRMLEETKGAVVVAPIVIAMAMVARENASRGSSDLLRRLKARPPPRIGDLKVR